MLSPEDLLLGIFDHVAEFTPGIVDQRILLDCRQRNHTLTACALVYQA